VHLLQEEPEAGLTLLAGRTGLSASRLSRLFKSQMRMPLVQFRNFMRLKKFLRVYGSGQRVTMLTAALVGRPLGMLLAIGAGLAVGLHLPRHVGVRELLVITFATSSGFSLALFFATGLLATGPVLAAIKVGVILSASGALLAFAAARLLKVGRFAH